MHGSVHTLPATSSRALAWLPAWFAVLFLAAGCNDTAFDPFQESDLAFSIFGYLDVGTDTQFVRVSPLRDSIAIAPEPLDAVVTLEHLATGRTVAFRDSLFSYQDGEFVRYAHNYWSMERLEPATSYRFSVMHPAGESSAVTVALPDTFPDPEIVIQSDPFANPPQLAQSIRMTGIERLADVQLTYCVQASNSSRVLTYVVSYLEKAVFRETDIVVVVKQGTDFAAISERLFGAPFTLLGIKVVVAAAGPDWPDLRGIDLETLALPVAVTNVERGVGYLGGIASKTLFWPGFGEWPAACE